MNGAITAEEKEQLSEAAETYSIKEWEEILEPLAQSATPDQSFDIKGWEKEIQFILGYKERNISARSPLRETPGGHTKVIPMRRRWIKWAAAACIILLVGIATYTVISNRWAAQPGSIGEKSPAVSDVPAPSNTRAVITLADGSKVYLDSASNGTIAQENNVNVVKKANGEIIYSHEGTKAQSDASTPLSMTYNTLFNPRGSKVISLTLSDGTRVWLNAESSLRYPASFAPSAVREVEITGEAYFEVAHIEGASIAPGFNPGKKGSQNKLGFSPMPFIVKKGDVSVTVLGTHFNVNAYNDESDIKVTLLEGSVKVSTSYAKTAAPSAFIKPGQQAVVTLRQAQGDNKILVQDNIDVDEVMAWKNGLFSFDNTDLKAVMRQVARWYDVEVVYEGGVSNEAFMGGISRQENISALLKVLEATNKVHFKIEGKKITVTK